MKQKTIQATLIFAFLSFVIFDFAFSQLDIRIPDSTHTQILTLKDGSSLVGRVVEILPAEIRFASDLGVSTIPKMKIEKVKEVPLSSMKNGEYLFENPNATRLFFGPTARTLRQGEGYLSDAYIFFPLGAIGITNNITLAAGFSIFPGIDLNEQIYYFAPKIGFTSEEKYSLAVGALILKPPISEMSSLGIFYGVGTFGDPNGSITAGLGFGYVESEIANTPMIMLGGEKRVSRGLSLVTENWILPGESDALLSYGLRFFGESLSFDFAFITGTGEGAPFPGIPFINILYKF